MRYINGRDLAAGQVLLPTDVERELVELVEQIEHGTRVLAGLVEQHAAKALDLDIAMARAMLRSGERSEGMRKADALIVCEELHREVQTLASKVRLCRDAQHDLRATLEAVRSIGASVRSSMWEGQGTGGSSGGGGGQGR